MYSFVLVVQVVSSLLICFFAFIAQSGGGTRDFTMGGYSADALMMPRHVNGLVVKVLLVLGFVFFASSMSLMVLDKKAADRLVDSVAAAARSSADKSSGSGGKDVHSG